MTKLSGVAAEDRLTEAWDTIFGCDPANQRIIHVLTRPTEYPTALTGFPPFKTWTRNGGKASDELWRDFAEIATPWPYVRDARRAGAAGIPNTRIFVLKRDEWKTAPPWLQYLSEVHLPAISGLAGEALYRVWLEDCLTSGLPDREYDVNLWGAAGVMLTGYHNGDVDWRAFLDDDRDPGRSLQEHDFVVSMHAFAAARGESIELPPELHRQRGVTGPGGRARTG
jgi:hypothetical protein